MPLTISHPAASVPFARMGLPPSALVIGSLTPDLPYYVFAYSINRVSHSIPGLILFCLPAGLALLYLFQCVLKNPCFPLLPSGLQQRLYSSLNPFTFWPLKRLLLISVSILIGGLSHILWDSFTHSYGWAVQEYPAFQFILFSIGTHPVPLYELLQHLSSLLGMLLLAIWFTQWFKNTAPVETPAGWMAPKRYTVLIIPAMCLVALGIAVITGFRDIVPLGLATFQRWSLLLGHIFIVFVSVFFLEMMLYSGWWYALQKRRNSNK